MDIWYKVELVQKMQDFIIENSSNKEFRFETLYAHVGYSKRHADRCFKTLTGHTPREYLKLIKMTNSAKKLIGEKTSILDAALDADFDSHEGYTKAFRDVFGKTPCSYRQGKCFIPLFIPYSIKGHYSRILNKENDTMEKTAYVMITPVQRPKRKLIFLRSKKAYDYWTYCEEAGCDWEGLLNSNPAKFDTAAILTLPPFLLKDGFGAIASGIEVPLDYNGEIPENFEIAELPPCDMLFFQSKPSETPQSFFTLIGEAFKAVDNFDYEAYGYKNADCLAPRFNFGGDNTGAKLAIPVERR